ncbi:uncharacterized protein LOC142563382 [Dermacentor variabilis]|uniref:uncharacterized protein LOC142563382 n=1 Tax=Dermacentor variabilis TaxID=34621 RepID=UPI003F5C77FB
MGNPSYHSVKQDKVPHINSPKKAIQAWLSGKGAAWSCDMVKVELIKRFDCLSTDGDRYRVDCIAEAAGRLVLHLPPYHSQLNHIELVWGDVSGFAASKNKTSNLQYLEPLVWQGTAQGTADKWKNYVEHVLSQEDEM